MKRYRIKINILMISLRRLKALFFVFTISLTGFISLFGQEVRFGISGGLTLSDATLYPKPITDYEYLPLLSLSTNLHIDYKHKKVWGISVEPGYINKRYIKRIGQDFSRWDDTTSFDYFNIPMLIDFYIKNRIVISAGPEINLGLIRSELAAIIGLGYDFDNYINLGIRYNHGLISTSEIRWGDTGKESKGYTQYLMFYGRVYISNLFKKD